MTALIACEEEAAVLIASPVAGITFRALGLGRIHLTVFAVRMAWAVDLAVTGCAALLVRVADEQAGEVGVAVGVARMAGLRAARLDLGRVHFTISAVSLTWAVAFAASWCEALLAKLPFLIRTADEQAVAVGVAVGMARTTRLAGPVTTSRE